MAPTNAAATTAASTPSSDSKTPARRPAEKKYKCQFCSRAFSRSEHRSRHERSHTKERPFKCTKCRSTFVRRDLLLRHDRTVHAKDGGAPLQTEGRKRSGPKTSPQQDEPIEDFNAPEDGQMDGQMDGEMDTLDGANEDIQAAAMLMTDFRNKAMQDHEPDISSHDGMSAGSLGSIPFGAESVSLPQMDAWETLVPQSMPGQNPMHDPMSFINPNMGNSPAMTQQHVPHFAQNLDHTGVAPGSIASFGVGSTASGGMGTPGALSPFPSMMGPVSPVDYRKSPGPQQSVSITRAPQVNNDEQCARILENIKRSDSEVALLETFHLPNKNTLNRYLSNYFDLFHHHLPFLHTGSFNPTEVAAPLLLSTLSIGALYTFEQEQAFMLHIGSKVLINQWLQKRDNFSSRQCPLWTMQATLLNMMFASWSGDPKGLEWACSIKSLISNMVAGNRYELKLRTEAREGRPPTHKEWIEDEGCRRSYYAVYIFFGMLTLTFNHTPAITYNEFDSLDLPSSESLWTMGVHDEEGWRESLTASPIITFREAHDRLFQGEVAIYSAFGTRVMINALFLEVWYHKRSPDALQDVVTEYKMRVALDQWQKSLEICQPETVVVNLSSPQGKQGHPLIFNALAQYRITRARLLVDLRDLQESMRYHDSFEVAAQMTNARDAVKRSSEMINVIQECFDCIQIPAETGIRWVARTSGTRWSVEHPLCGLELMVILSLWLWRLEHDEEPATEEESAMYNRLKNLFEQDSVQFIGSKLSATIAHLWGSMFDEVVVWGITKLIGESFKLHSQALVGFEDSVAQQEADMHNQQNGRMAPSPKFQPIEMTTAY